MSLRLTGKRQRGAVFSLRLPVNYEDTDAAGVVYYGNYPGYMERARNACLRELGFSLTRLKQQYSLLFVVIEANLKYRSPARLDDEIEVTMEVLRLRHVSMALAQQVRRNDKILVDAKIKLAMVNSDTLKPCRMPAELAAALSPESTTQSPAQSSAHSSGE